MKAAGSAYREHPRFVSPWIDTVYRASKPGNEKVFGKTDNATHKNEKPTHPNFRPVRHFLW